MAIIYVTSTGASPANADNTAAIQSALDKAQAGDTVLIPAAAGNFMINAVKSLRPKSGTTLQIDGTLQVIPNGTRWTAAVLLDHVSDVTVILNGGIVGDHDTHANKTDDNGFGVAMIGSINPTLTGKGIIRSCAGDGVYVDHGCKNVKWSLFTSTSNRRQGASVIDVDGLDADGVSLLNTIGNLPGAGIDFEPDRPVGTKDENGVPGTQAIRNVKMRNCKMLGNRGASVLICCPQSAKSNIDIDSSNQMDDHPIDGTDGTVAFWAKWFYYVFHSYALYPRSIKI